MRALLVLLATMIASPVWAGPSEDLSALIEEYWAFELQSDPFYATAVGVGDYNDAVPASAPGDYKARAEKITAFAARLAAIDHGALTKENQLNADLLGFILKHRIAQAPFKTWRIPFLADTGFHTDFAYALSATPFRTAEDYENYNKRLRAFPEYIDQNIGNMRQGLADGFTQPKEILPNVLPSFEALIKDEVEAHPYFAPYLNMSESIPNRQRKRLREDAEKIVGQEVMPAFERLYAFMKDEYAPNARETLGASGLPEGKAYYEAQIRYYTSLDDATADSIHEIGLKEVARIRREMDKVIAETGFKGDFKEFLAYLRSDEQFYAKTPEALLERAAWLSKDIDGKLPAYFGKLPRQPYSVEPVPDDIAPNYTTGRYIGAPANADRGGQYWVNTYNLKQRPLYALPALTLHEAVPGHHLQNALALEIENAPDFRKDFYPHAFGEGWGLYSEKLGVEMGVYQTPYDHFGRLSYEMWRACRLVIDTGLHAKGWTRDQAVAYLASHTALSLHNVNTEVDRYIAWPGQALAYKMGELTIWELRKKAERELGDQFDIRAFHDAVLTGGGLPLEILRAQIDSYIADAKAGKE